jgi:hypothetical protein
MMMLTGLLASFASVTPARADCAAARTVGSVASLPDAWREALAGLLRSTAEPGHPWSCLGGTIELTLEPDGARLGVAREAQEAAQRHVNAPEDVLPLGQALLATPLAASSDAPPARAEPAPAQDAVLVQREAAPVPPSKVERAATRTSEPSRSLLLSLGVDARAVGGSNVAWIGPTLSAAVVLGRWLPSISLRQQSSIASHTPDIDELSVALALQRQFEISSFELRTGLALRGAVVQRDLPHQHGEQSRVEGRIGLLTSFAIPVLRWANLVLALDAEFVAVSRETAEPPAAMNDEAPTPFPTYTLGGSVCFEVSL